MRVAVAGATGVLGRATVPRLIEAGHEVRGFARNPRKHDGDRNDLVAVDLLDRNAVIGFAEDWRPEAIVHLATAIPAEIDTRKIAKAFEQTNRLRTDGTRNLVAAAEAVGAELISQSLAFVYAPGPGLATEDDPLWDGPVMGSIVSPIAELERLTNTVDGTVLRFGQLYGPGTTFDPPGAISAAVAARKMPIVRRRGGGVSTFSFTHAGDAAGAVVAALARPGGGPSTFNIVDDDPALVSEWLPVLARLRGGPEPRTVPAWLARPIAGAYGVAYMTELRGASNARAKAELGWSPAIPSWRQGFVEG